MCDRLQMGAERASSAEQADIAENTVYTLKIRGGG